MSSLLRLLLVEDSEDDARLIALELQRSGYGLELECVDTPKPFALRSPGKRGTSSSVTTRCRALTDWASWRW